MVEALQYAIDALSLGSLYALAALGIGLLFGVLRLINFAHGDFISIGAYALIVPSLNVMATMYIGALPWPAMVAAVVVVVILVALVSEAVVFRPLRAASPATMMIGSFALSFVIQYVLLLIYGSRPKAVDLWSILSQQIAIGGVRIQQLQLVTIVVTALLLAALALFLHKTRFGVEMRAAAEDFRMARLLGVRANLVIALAFALSGGLAAVVSLLYLTQSGILTIQMGVPLMLFAFIATVVGGMGSLLGAVVGGFTVGILSVALQVLLPSGLRSFRDAFVFLLVIAILLWRPTGLVQARAIKERV
jgi:branched-chain amino acid transport system permease protein